MNDILTEEIIVSEALLCGIFWNNPNEYNFYTKDKLSSKHFGNKHYGFYFELGRYMNSKGISILDDISTAQAINELGFQKHYNKYGEYETISELIEETKDKKNNADAYIAEVKKYYLLRELRELYGNKIIEENGNYNYKKLNAEQLIRYWRDKLENLALNIESEIPAHNLLQNLRELVNDLDNNPDVGMPYYKSKLVNDATNGWARGTTSLYSMFSGNGKTSYSTFSHVMSCIQHNEKLAIIGNEMSNKSIQKLLLITIIGNELYGKIDDKGFNRKNISRGNFTENEKEKLLAAVDWVEDLVENKELIKFIPLEDYTMDNVEKIIRYWANRGYFYWIIDTLKPTSDSGDSRWTKFVQDSERLYQLARPDGLNLAMHWNAQSADEALKSRFLNELCLADGRKIKNVVDFCAHFRPLKEDEYEGGKNAIDIYRWLPDAFSGELKKTIIGQPNKKHVYYAMFVSKSRMGESNINGLDVIIFRVDLNSNRWIEEGYTSDIKNDLF